MEYSHALFVYLHLLKLLDIYERGVGQCMYNYVYASLPQSLSDMFTFVRDIHIYETRRISQIRPWYVKVR